MKNVLYENVLKNMKLLPSTNYKNKYQRHAEAYGDRNLRSHSTDKIYNYGNFVDTSRRLSQSTRSMMDYPKRYYALKSVFSSCNNSVSNDNSFINMINTNQSHVPKQVLIKDRKKIRTKSNPNIKSKVEKSKKTKNSKHDKIKIDINDKLKSLVNVWIKEAVNQIKNDPDKIQLTKSNSKSSRKESDNKDSDSKNSYDNNSSESSSKVKMKSELSKLNEYCQKFLKEKKIKKDHLTNVTQMYDILDNVCVLLKSYDKKYNSGNENKNVPVNFQTLNKDTVEFIENNKNKELSESDLSSIECNASMKCLINKDNIKTKYVGDCKEVYKNNNLKNDTNLIDSEIKQSKPYFSNKDKSIIGEILSYPKIQILSRCILEVNDKFVEEQFVIKTIRYITNEEKEKFIKINDKQDKILFKTITTGLVNSTLIDEKYDNHTDIYFNIKNEYTQTSNDEIMPIFRNNISPQLSVNLIRDEIETLSWESDNISHDSINNKSQAEINFGMSQGFVSPIMGDDLLFDRCEFMIDKPERLLNLNCLKDKNEFNIKMSEQLLYASSEMVNILNLSIDELNDNNYSIWSIHGTKIRNCFYKIDRIYEPSIQLITPIKLDKIPDRSIINDVLIDDGNTNKPVGLPPTGPSSVRINKLTSQTSSNDVLLGDDSLAQLEINSKDIKESLEKDIPLPENLTSLYERLSKLQKMLECIPEEKITSTLEALDQIDYSPVSTPECNNNDQDNWGTMLEFSTKNNTSNNTNYIKSKKKSSRNKKIDDNNSKELIKNKNNQQNNDESKSDVTTSLSMLENLIDDFLLKNGLSNLSGV